MILCRFTRGDRSSRLLDHALQRALGGLDQTGRGEQDPPEPFGMLVANHARECHALLERGLRLREVIGLLQGLAETDAEKRAGRPIRDEFDRAPEQVHRRGDVLPAHGCLCGGLEPLGGSSSNGRVGCAELGSVAVCLLQVVADDFVGASLPSLVSSQSAYRPWRAARCRFGTAS